MAGYHPNPVYFQPTIDPAVIANCQAGDKCPVCGIGTLAAEDDGACSQQPVWCCLAIILALVLFPLGVLFLFCYIPADTFFIRCSNCNARIEKEGNGGCFQ